MYNALVSYKAKLKSFPFWKAFFINDDVNLPFNIFSIILIFYVHILKFQLCAVYLLSISQFPAYNLFCTMFFILEPALIAKSNIILDIKPVRQISVFS